jgi:hypothetical protein
MFNSSFKQFEEFCYLSLLKPAALDVVYQVDASVLVVSVVSWTHSTISFQRLLSLCSDRKMV